MDKIFSDKVTILIDKLWVNQAGACQIALALYEEWATTTDIIEWQTFEDWCRYKFEEAPYDEYE